MSRFRSFAFFLAALLFVTPGWSQTSTRQIDLNPASVGSPIAFVYVTRPTHIDGFAVSSSGKLTPVPGSPFANIAASSLSVNKKFLFAAGDNNKDIYTFAIASDGAIKRVSEIDVQKYSDGCGTIGPLQIDNTGSTVYLQVNDGCQDNLFIQSFRIESNGDLQYLGNVSEGPPDVIQVFPPVKFIGDNKIAWESTIGDDDGLVGSGYGAYERKSDGLLVAIGGGRPPNPKNPDDQYLTTALATDSTDHLAAALEDYSNDSGEIVGSDVLATYTSDSHGNLTTRSTYENMPTSEVSPVITMSISPSGKVLAAGGQGFELFHFNRSSPITKYAGLLQAKDSFVQFGWDADDHLYALSSNALFVYKVTSAGITESPGSPHSIPEASSVVVLNK